MFGVYDRHLIGELLLTMAGVVSALIVVLASNRLIRYLGEVVNGRLPGDLVATLLGFKSIEYLDQLLPISLYLSILLLFGRLYRDREISVLASAAVPTSRLLRPMLIVALPLMAFQLTIALELAPWAVRQQLVIEEELARRSDIATLQPGRFLESRRGLRVLYVESMGEEQDRFTNLFIHQLKADGRYTVHSSASGSIETDPANGLRYLEMRTGSIYDGQPGAADYRVIHYDRYRLLVDEGPQRVSDATSQEAMGLRALIADDGRAASIELQWRLAGVAATLLFVLMALPLSRTGPRQGRFSRLALAILIYLVYFNLFGTMRGLTERGELPVVVGVWGVPALVAFATGVLWLIESGRHRNWRRGGARWA